LEVGKSLRIASPREEEIKHGHQERESIFQGWAEALRFETIGIKTTHRTGEKSGPGWRCHVRLRPLAGGEMTAVPTPATTPAEEAEALATKLKSRGLANFWLEAVLILFPLTIVVFLFARFGGDGGFLVVTHSVRTGTRLKPADVAFARAGHLNQAFGRSDNISVLTINRDLAAGAPLRWSDVQRLQPVSTASIGTSEVINDKNVTMKLTAYDSYSLGDVPRLRQASRRIDSATILRDDMIAPPSKVAAPAPKTEVSVSSEVEMPLRVFLGPLRPALGSEISLLMLRKTASPLRIKARLIALDATASPATVVVAVSPAAALRILGSSASEVYVTRGRWD
jgi:hypothetical protein